MEELDRRHGKLHSTPEVQRAEPPPWLRFEEETGYAVARVEQFGGWHGEGERQRAPRRSEEDAP
eukprot:14762821-Heterocapsa_arctica.AAC.1